MFLYYLIMDERIHINVSTIDYDKTSKVMIQQLSLLEEMVHIEDSFVLTDSEFAFGWHFFVLSVNISLIQKLVEMIGPDFKKLKGKSIEKKFLTWLTNHIEGKSPRFKIAIKEEMESSRFGIF